MGNFYWDPIFEDLVFYEWKIQQQGSPQSHDYSLFDLVKKTYRRADGTYSDPYIEGVVREVEEETSQYQGSSITTYSQVESHRERVNRLYLEKVNPRYGEAYGASSAKTQFYHPYVPYSSWTQGDIRDDFEDFKVVVSRRLDSLEGSSSEGPSQELQNPSQVPHDPSQVPGPESSAARPESSAAGPEPARRLRSKPAA